MKTKVAKAIAEHSLFNAGDTVVVAVSGGADSVALLDMLASLEELRLKLVAAHLNHSLRGDESDGDESFVRKLASDYGLPAEIARVDVKGLSRRKRLSLEEAGRVARYEFFLDIARSYGAHSIALAHHADDQAETVLMRLLRGAGGTGLCAISPKSGATLVRPLLAVTRTEIETYLAQRNLPYRTDSTNRDTEFLRNRVRMELIPYLETYNPAVRDRLVATAEALARDEEVLTGVTDAAFARHGREGQGVITLDVCGCRAEPAGVRYRLYRRGILLAKGNLDRVGSGHLRDIDTMLFSRNPQMMLCLPDGLRVSKCYTEISFFPASVEKKPVSWEKAVEGPGVYTLPGGYRLMVEEVDPLECRKNPSPHVACFDAVAAPFPWLLRTFRPGDRIMPFGMTGHKKVKDLFIDEKIPMASRRRIPLLFSGDRLLWVSTLRTSAEGCVTDRSRRAVSVEILDMYSLMGL
ncbi:MAG TPA: tRNA lysidine(34) synthetase TilS [Geobacteraceae bacterium]|nr:tRNA lysidine(34) synthetase TilS [Geobacteraceae bacterium]